MEGCLYLLALLFFVVVVGILIPAWILQIVLSAFGIDVSIWICILIFILIGIVARAFKN